MKKIKKKTVTISIKTTEELAAKLRAYAENNNRGITELIEEFISKLESQKG